MSSIRFGLAKSPQEIINNETKDQSFRISPYSTIVEKGEYDFTALDLIASKKWSDDVKRFHDSQYKKIAQAGSGWKPPKDKNIKWKYIESQIENFTRQDLSQEEVKRFLSRFVEGWAIYFKILDDPHRKTSPNDIADIEFFYLLPYVDTFITERNNIEIVNKIRQRGFLQGLMVRKVSEM